MEQGTKPSFWMVTEELVAGGEPAWNKDGATMKTEFTTAHEYAEIFPLHDTGVIELSKRIESNGLREPCVMLDGKMLDGRRRERACHRAGVKPTFREFGSRKTDGDSPLEFVFDLNMHRRHLGDGERVLAAAKYATAKGGGDRKSPKSSVLSDGSPSQIATVIPTNKEAADKFDVTESKIDRAKKVIAKGTPALQAAVADETISVSDAAKVADKPPKVQDKAVEDVKAGRARTAKSAAEPKPKPKPGKPIFDDRSINDLIGKLARAFDARAVAYGKGAKHQACINALDKVLSAYDQWRAER